MKYSKIVLLFFFGVVFLSSCSPKLSPFTQRLYEENNWSDSDLKRIQFYLSRDIVLRREASRGKSEITSGEIKVVDGRRVEEIVIREGTPGVFLFSPKEDRFAVSFEEGKNKRYLIFGASNKTNGKYTLRAKNWDRRQGEVTYEGRKYYTPSESAYATLMVDLKQYRTTKRKSRTAGGRTID